MDKKLENLQKKMDKVEKLRENLRRKRDKMCASIDANTKLDDKLWYKSNKIREEIEKYRLSKGLGIKVSIALKGDKEINYSCTSLSDALSSIQAKCAFYKSKGERIDLIDITINPEWELKL